MSTPTFNYRHTLTGKLARMTEDAASATPDYLERVPDDAKPFAPGLFKPGKVGEFKNPEPLTDEQEAAQAALDDVLESSAPNSKAARAAKAEKEATDQAAADALAEAEAADAAARADAESGEGDKNEGTPQ